MIVARALKSEHLARAEAKQLKETSAWENTRNISGLADWHRIRLASGLENGRYR
jgi:hypothetical protein